MKLNAAELSAGMKVALDESDDTDLHRLFGAHVAANITTLIEQAEFADLPGMNDVAIEMLQELLKRIQSLEKERELQKSALEKAQGPQETDIREITELYASISLLNKHHRCRNLSCGVEFRAQLHSQGNGVHNLRCGMCNCRHH